MELVKPVEPVLWACIVELVMGGTGYGTVEALIFRLNLKKKSKLKNKAVIKTAYRLVMCCLPGIICWKIICNSPEEGLEGLLIMNVALSRSEMFEWSTDWLTSQNGQLTGQT